MVESIYPVEGLGEVINKFIRVRLTNEGRRVARDCRVFLVEVEEISNAGGAHKTKFNESMPLSWAGFAPPAC